MTKEELEKLVKCGETTTVQFKQTFESQTKVAEEMVAFANTTGGHILFGIQDKTGLVVGLEYADIQQTSRELGNTANEHVRPTIYIQTEVVELNGKMILVATIQEGKFKPYKDLKGQIWVKQGADKRRVTDNAEILSLFQESDMYHPDSAGVPDTSARDIDTMALDDYFDKNFGKPIDDFDLSRDKVLENLHITDNKGRLTLAGLMFFGKRPQNFRPTFVVKAVWFYGNNIGGTKYRDSRDLEGTVPEMYEQGIMWLKSCLNRPQNGQSFNSVGELEIPEPVLEELLQNALIHLDLLKPASIRLLVFDDRVEIVNAGCLPGGQTVEQVMLGNSFPRNPQMVKFCAKTMPYRGLGSGIPRALSEKCRVEFINSREGNQFIARIWRTEVNNEGASQKELGASQKAIIEMISANPKITTLEIAERIGIDRRNVQEHINKLQKLGVLRRENGRKNGHWVLLI